MAQQYEYARFNSTTVQLIRFCPSLLVRSPSFNSTTVQLIQRVVCVWVWQGRCFNSTTVQLIQGRSASSLWYPKFQFHNGTINTQNAYDRIKKKNGFNSTTVQLIQLGEINQGYAKESFNSTTVQLIQCYECRKQKARAVSIPQRYN